jgi:hypothetical protein
LLVTLPVSLGNISVPGCVKRYQGFFARWPCCITSCCISAFAGWPCVIIMSLPVA